VISLAITNPVHTSVTVARTRVSFVIMKDTLFKNKLSVLHRSRCCGRYLGNEI
jgi:hypothetical protein